MTLITSAQVQYNHPELNWHTFETEHFVIHYHDETEWTAREGAYVAERIYPSVTGLYHHEPVEKTQIIFIDTDDISNGLASAYDNRVVIWASPLDYALRGSHRWLQNVITHEFTHIVSIQKAMKAGTKIPGAYLQFMGYEDYKRKDVLYGFPNRLVSYPIPASVVPPWLAEGVAQYMYDGATWDTWDSHRDMILRDRTLNDNLLSFTEMNTFGKKGIGNESTYNAGFALSRYIAVKYGPDKLQRIMEELGKPTCFSVDRAIQKAIGISGRQLYEEFHTTLELRYDLLTAKIKVNTVQGKVLQSEGTTNVFPRWNPDGTAYAYLSNKENDFFGQTDLYVFNFKTGIEKLIANGVGSAAAWDKDGSHLYYSKKSKYPNRHGSRFYDLFVYDIAAEKERRLTCDARGYSPVFLEADSSLAYLATYDGSQNIFTLDLKSGTVTQRTDFQDHRMLQGLSFDHKTNRLVFDYTVDHFRNIGYYSLSDTSLGDLMAEPFWDERDGNAGEKGLIYSDDRSGIFNLYLIDDQTGFQGYLTNVTGGAFMADRSISGKILYSLYSNGKYNVALLDTVKVIPDTFVGYSPLYFERNRDLTAHLTGRDSSLAQPYEDQFSEMFILPKMMWDYGTFKPGFYFYSGEVLNRLAIFGGASLNAMKDIDIFFLFEFNRFYPTLFLETFYLTRHIKENSSYSVYNLDDKIRYRLTFFRGGLRFPILGQHTLEVSTGWQVYRAFIDQSIPAEQIEGGFAYDYFRGWVTGIHWNTTAMKPRIDEDINPSKGFALDWTLNYEKNDFIEGLDLSDAGTIIPKFSKSNDLLRFEGSGQIHWEIPHTPRWTVNLDASAGWMNNTEADSFFNFFGGGMTGIRGYPFYSIEGNRLAIGTLTVRVPILREKHIPIGWFTLQNSVFGFVLQSGDAWSEKFQPKPSVGIQWRFNGFSFYNFPTAIGLEVHQGLTSISNEINNKVYHYGKSNRYYLTVLFGF